MPGRNRLSALLLASALAALPAPSRAASTFELGAADAAWIPVALGLQGAAQYRYHTMDPVQPSELDRNDLWAFDRPLAGTWSPGAALASDLLIYPWVAAPLALSSLEAWRGQGAWKHVLSEAVVYSEALAISSALCLIVRSTRVHPRPYQFGDEAPASARKKGEAAGSFYSGHSSTAFLVATWLAYTYPRRNPDFNHEGLLWAGALGYAATVAGLRVAAGKHFPSDVVAGAAAGILLGWAAPSLRMGGGDGKSAELRALPRTEGVHPVLVIRF